MKEIDQYGTIRYAINGQLHREDGPAIESVDGYKSWYINNKRHRTDGPAVEYANGSKEWWMNSERHRTDGPAIEYKDGHEEWFYKGEQLYPHSLEDFQYMIKIIDLYPIKSNTI